LKNYYHGSFDNNEQEARKIFQFCKEMGIETIVSEPKPEAMPLLDKLTAEYGINLAIHNHPKHPNRPNYLHWNPHEVMKMIKGCNPRVGACADTGHWVRSGIDPVEALKIYEGRIIALHLKDLNEKDLKAHDVPWGTGVTDIKAVLKELKRQNFSGVMSIEYEHNWDNNMSDIKKCIDYFKKTATEMGVLAF